MQTTHHCTDRQFAVCVTNGSQDGLSKAFDLFIDEGEEG
jgi:hypothetical protein